MKLSRGLGEMELSVSEQGGLFEEHRLEPHDVDWFLSQWLDAEFHPDADIHAFWFGRNVWGLLRGSSHWRAIQDHPIDALLWVLVIAESYSNFVYLALEDGPELGLNIFGLLDEHYSDEEAVIDAVTQRFYGYGLEDVESFGMPDPSESSPFSLAWNDRLIDAVSETRSDLRTLLRERVGADELILNFYRDPFVWDKRLKGEAMPAAQQPLQPVEWVKLSKLLEATGKLFDVFI